MNSPTFAPGTPIPLRPLTFSEKLTTAYHSIPGVPFLLRTWPLLFFVVGTNYLAQWKHVFSWVKDPDGTWRGLTLLDLIGPTLYFLPLASTTIWFALLILAIRNNKTVEADALSGQYVEDWKNLSPAERVWNTTIRQVGYLITGGLIMAALAK